MYSKHKTDDSNFRSGTFSVSKDPPSKLCKNWLFEDFCLWTVLPWSWYMILWMGHFSVAFSGHSLRKILADNYYSLSDWGMKGALSVQQVLQMTLNLTTECAVKNCNISLSKEHYHSEPHITTTFYKTYRKALQCYDSINGKKMYRQCICHGSDVVPSGLASWLCKDMCVPAFHCYTETIFLVWHTKVLPLSLIKSLNKSNTGHTEPHLKTQLSESELFLLWFANHTQINSRV